MQVFTPDEIIATLNQILDIDNGLVGMNYLKVIVKRIAQIFNFEFVFTGHTFEPNESKIQTDIVWAMGNYQENFTYDLSGTPCENVLGENRVCIYPKQVAQRFPEDTLLIDMGVESYVGAPLHNADGKFNGLLVFLKDQELTNLGFYNAVADFLSARVGAELERHYIQKQLKKLVITDLVTTF